MQRIAPVRRFLAFYLHTLPALFRTNLMLLSSFYFHDIGVNTVHLGIVLGKSTFSAFRIGKQKQIR